MSVKHEIGNSEICPESGSSSAEQKLVPLRLFWKNMILLWTLFPFLYSNGNMLDIYDNLNLHVDFWNSKSDRIMQLGIILVRVLENTWKKQCLRILDTVKRFSIPNFHKYSLREIYDTARYNLIRFDATETNLESLQSADLDIYANIPELAHIGDTYNSLNRSVWPKLFIHSINVKNRLTKHEYDLSYHTELRFVPKCGQFDVRIVN